MLDDQSHRRLLPRTDLHVREVETIDIENQTVTTTPGFRPAASVIHYDHLVLALGMSRTSAVCAVCQSTRYLQNLSDALYIRIM